MTTTGAEGRLGAALGRGTDALLDALVVAFAAWTLFYEVALALHLSLWTPSLAWLVATVVCTLAAVVVAVVRAVRRTSGPAPEQAPDPPPRGTAYAARLPSWAWPLALLALVVVLGVHLYGPRLGLRVGLLPVVAAALLVLALGAVEVLGRTDAGPVPTVPGTWSHLGAWAVAAGLGLLAAALVKPDGDDVFYVNQSVWVAEHGVASLRDTMFGPQTYPSTYGGGLPLASVEGLLGALAHVVHRPAGSVVYLVATPLLGLLTGLAWWRLVRAWAVRRHLLVLVVAVAFVLMSAQSITGGYFVGRIWQGKVAAYCVLLPLVWCYLGRALDRAPDNGPGSGPGRDLLLPLAAGTAFVGLSSTAALQVPMVAVPALLAALLLRRTSLARSAGALMVAPVASGLVQLLAPGGAGGATEAPTTVTKAWQLAFGLQPALVLLAVLAWVVGVRLARGRQPLVLALASAAALATLLPGVFGLVDAVTGAGSVEWRLLIGIPTAVLVGMLVSAAPIRTLTATPTLLVPALVLAALAWQGQPVWVSQAHARLQLPPVWKVDPQALRDVRALLRTDGGTGPGPWLLPPRDMGVLAVVTTRHAAVVPRKFYLHGLGDAPGAHRARQRLLALESGVGTPPTVPEIAAALRRLHVPVACVDAQDHTKVRLLDQAAGRAGERVGSLNCHAPAQSFWSISPVSTS